jgi:negative regulator of sigma E activity
MNTMIQSARLLLVASLFTVGLSTAGLAQAETPRFVGPRNTIPQVQTRTASQERSYEQLRASTEDASMCHSVRFKHYGHPGKGYNRIEKADATCGRSRLSVR